MESVCSHKMEEPGTEEIKKTRLGIGDSCLEEGDIWAVSYFFQDFTKFDDPSSSKNTINHSEDI